MMKLAKKDYNASPGKKTETPPERFNSDLLSLLLGTNFSWLVRSRELLDASAEQFS